MRSGPARRRPSPTSSTSSRCTATRNWTPSTTPGAGTGGGATCQPPSVPRR
jgi:hypothetical protein